ncbi:MAG: hypothetical protein ACI8P9_002054 [Parasphingorhabdus sp.]|jgi:hypothetical protein
MRNILTEFSRAFACLAIFSVTPALATTEHNINPQIGTHTWKRTSDEVTYSLTQILPDQIRAFFSGRGFPVNAIEELARTCVFMTVVRNGHTTGSIHFKTADWMVQSNGQSESIRSTESWLNHWKDIGLELPQLIAFEWGQFPVEHIYQPGDWNQGMLIFSLDSNSSFNLHINWAYQNKLYTGVLDEVICAN